MANMREQWKELLMVLQMVLERGQEMVPKWELDWVRMMGNMRVHYLVQDWAILMELMKERLMVNNWVPK